MKRISTLVMAFVIAFLLTGCSGKTDLSVNQIKYKEKVLTYGSTEVDDVFFDDGIDLVINDSNMVRCISITNADVITYSGISVGDKIARIESQYSSETNIGSTISVTLSGGKEIDPTSQDKPDDTIWISYVHDGGKITKIMIYDVVYGEKMR